MKINAFIETKGYCTIEVEAFTDEKISAETEYAKLYKSADGYLFAWHDEIGAWVNPIDKNEVN